MAAFGAKRTFAKHRRLLSANCGLMHCSNEGLFDHLVSAGGYGATRGGMLKPVIYLRLSMAGSPRALTQST